MHRIRKSNMAFTLLTVGVLGQAAVTHAKGPDVELELKCPNLRYVGRDATFEITVTNKGDAPAHNVLVTDMLPKQLEFRSADNDGKRDGGNVVWRLGTLEPGQSRTVNATLRCLAIGKYRNAATVAYCAELRADCEMEVKGIPAILLECVDDPDPIEVGNMVTYTITVTNQGSAVGTNVTINCTLPAELEYVAAKGPTAGSADGGKVTFAPLATLAPQAKAVFTVTAKGAGEGDVRFAVEMKSDQIDTPVMETESTHVYE